jgi:hypothetical protein
MLEIALHHRQRIVFQGGYSSPRTGN